MAFTIKDYSPEDLADILAGTQEILDTTWELTWLKTDLVELIAFLINAIRKEPEFVTGAFIEKISKFWSLTLADAEATVVDLLAMHGESAGDTIVEDLCTLEIIFSI